MVVIRDRERTLGEILATRGDFVGAGTAVDWQEAMRRAIRRGDQLLRRLGLAGSGDGEVGGLTAAERDFPTFVPLEFLGRMRPGDPDDPLLLQVVPRAIETEPQPGFVGDPVGDTAARISPGLLQKYEGRALVIATGVCGVHCRYCFRRQYDYHDTFSESTSANGSHSSPGGTIDEAAMVRRLRQDRSIDEVILSGGDPLTLGDPRLDRLLAAIESVPHVRRLRVHSRMPIVIPQRVTESLIQRLQVSRLATWMVVHCNHAQEIDAAVTAALARMVDAGIPVLNQAVLLAGVNDSAAALESLCRELVDRRVQPYYLHQLDRISGAAHFEVPVSRGLELIEQLRGRLPGYAVPVYVSEVAGAASKLPN